MIQKKYTLPRHTILAKQSSRIGAFFVDLAIFVAITLAFFFGCFRLILSPMAQPYREELYKEEANSHLCIRTSDSGPTIIIPTDSDFYEYRDRIAYYYINYLTGNVSEPGTGSRTANEPIVKEDGSKISKADYYTISWFNSNILGITAADPEKDSSCLFTYEKVGETYDKTKLGIPKDATKVSDVDVRNYMKEVYVSTYTNSFNKLPYVIDVVNKSTFIYSLEIVLAGLIGAIVTYVVIPSIFKQGRTIGKKIFKLALATNDGYAFQNKQLAMRVMPLVVVLLTFLIPIWKDIFILMLIPLTVFLVSFALAMASPKKSSLHDFTARTIVVDDKASLIFENEFEEEEYIKKEDHLVDENDQHFDDEEGEEPEICYEK